VTGWRRPEPAVHFLRINPTNKAMARATNPHQASTSISLVDSPLGSIKELMRTMPTKKNDAQQDQIKILCNSPGLGDKYFRFIVVALKGCYSATAAIVASSSRSDGWRRPQAVIQIRLRF